MINTATSRFIENDEMSIHITSELSRHKANVKKWPLDAAHVWWATPHLAACPPVLTGAKATAELMAQSSEIRGWPKK